MLSKSFIKYSILALTLAISSSAQATVAVQSKIVDGTIKEKYADNTLKLDNGILYHPSRDDLIVHIDVNDPITLRYYVKEGQENVFFEFARGLRSLKHKVPKAAQTSLSLK